MNIRWKLPVVGIILCVSAIVSPELARAASYNSPPALPAPSGKVVNVSTETQLQNAVRAAAAGTTIVIAPGTYNLTGPLYFNGINDITLRGATNNRDDVVLAGPGMTNSSVEFGIWTSSLRTTIANLTVRDIYDHAIVLNGGAQSPHIYNVHLINTGQQFIKSNPDGNGGGVNNGIVEYSIIEYATTSRDDYTNGVDVHTGSGWIVRSNLFRNLIAPAGALAGPAVLMWNSSSGAIIDGNTFVNCQREISMGLQERTPDDNSGGIVRNNFIYRPAGIYADVGILVADSPGTQVLHNTIFLNGTYPNAIEYRFAGSRNVVIANNLTSAAIQARDGATGTASPNYTKATASMFVNPGAGDLHLVASATAAIDKVALLANAATDWDGQSRPSNGTADYGADEFGGGTGTPPPANQAPSVSLTSPASGTSYTAPTSVPLSAAASDGDGVVSSVSFYNGATLLGSDTSSPYTFTWSNVQAGTYSLTAVATDNGGLTTTSSPVSVTVSASGGGGGGGGTTLPAPWTTADIGNPSVAGSGSYTNGTFTVQGGGADIWAYSDQFGFAYQPMTGDGQIVARVASLTNPDEWSKAGVMIREQLTAQSSYAMALVSSAHGLAFQRRNSTGGYAVHTPGAGNAAPYWVKLVRAGSTFSAYQSPDGSSWQLIGSDQVSMATTVYVGLAVTAHNDGTSATGSFTGVSVSAATGNIGPSVSLNSPVSGATYQAPAAVSLIATASDQDGSVARVDFYNGSTLIGSDATSPYSFSWTNVPAGVYSVTAVATDNSGATATSAAASVTVGAVQVPSLALVFNPSADHDTNVTSYTVEIFAAGADPATAQAVASQNLGKPAVVGGVITVNILPLVGPLPAGSYIASVTAVGPGGSTRGAASNTFVH